MKRRIVFVLTVLGLSSIIAGFNIHGVRAVIWIEGHITSDTTWKPVDTYRVIGHTYVDPGVTLTIEPGVQVQFADGLSLIIEGSLDASGTASDPITFTSTRVENDPPDPYPGAWDGIKLKGTNSPIVLQHIAIRYAKNGIYLSGNLALAVLRMSEVELCEVGVLIGDRSLEGTYGNFTVEANQIHSNEHGIILTDLWSASVSHQLHLKDISIRNNRIFLNSQTGVSLSLTTMYNKNITIFDNIISSNQLSGVNIFATGVPTDSVSIYNNTISANGGGLLSATVYTDILPNCIRDNMESSSLPERPIWAGVIAYVYSTSYAVLFNNSISYNSYGIYFWDFQLDSEYARSRTALRFNDIYGNSEFGVFLSNVFAEAQVDAEQNYWGDSTGPYHDSWNPTGKGNPVNSGGTELDFIPFLASPHGLINQRPIAVLEVDKKNPDVNEIVTFDATSSHDTGRVDYYFFDFGDGTNSSWTTLRVVVHKYAEEGVFNATLVVMDDFGVTSLDGSLVYVTITVVPEFPSMLILPLFMLATLLAVLLYRRKHFT